MSRRASRTIARQPSRRRRKRSTARSATPSSTIGWASCLRRTGARPTASCERRRSRSSGTWTKAKLAVVHAVLSATQVFFSIILIALILMHSGKDAGLSGAFGVGGGSQLGSGSLVERNLNRWTIVFALLFVGNVFALLKT